MLVAAVEVESAGVGAAWHLELANVQNIKATRNIFPDGFFVGQVIAVLVDKCHAHGRALDHFAAVRLFLAGDQFKQRRLARAVRADDADDSAGGHGEAQVVDQHAVAKRFGDVLEFNHLGTEALGDGNENLIGLNAFLVFEIAQLFKACQP